MLPSLFIIIFLPAVLCISLYIYVTRHFNYWKKLGIPYIKPVPFFGTVSDIFTFKLSIGEVIQKAHAETDAPFIGMFICDEPALVVRDLDLIKNILIKDFPHFIDRTMTDNHVDDPMGSNILFIMKNPDWKEIRRKITPVFTSGKMKLMFKLILDSGEGLLDYLNKAVERDSVIETREMCAKYTTEAITSTSFGIKANCFNDENAEFRVVSRRIFNWNSFRRGVATTCYFISPTLVRLFHMKFIDGFSADFLRSAFWKTMHEREESNFVRNDLLDILIQMRKEQKIDDPYKLEGDKLVAQATQFFIAGYETTSSTISFCLYELAKHPDVQRKLREDILKTMKKHGEISYDAIKDMNYLNMCVDETLRKYPVLPFLDRRCNIDYRIPGTDFTIKKGIPVFISNIGLHFDPAYYPEPEKFIPERFTEENKESRPAFTYLPFGDGPRNCIGARYGLLSSKIGIAHIMSQYQVDLCPETQKQMKFDPKGFLLAPVKGLKLSFKKC